jgi:hypothetical protein
MAADEPPEPPEDHTRPTEPLRPAAPVPPTEPLRRPVAPRQPPVVPLAAPVVERVPTAALLNEPRWSNPWPAFLALLAGLLIGGIVGYLVSNHAETTQRANRSTPTRTVTNTRTVVQPKVLVRTNTVTSNTVTQAPPSPAGEEQRLQAEAAVKRLERENEELRRGAEGG